ncbi:MAG: hypothetical protein S4CHLAM81_07810 [Chlamydiales bacterium]|nr:hypothetical protein [Chlamydiales bacterium]MCH9635563.1 hypothetical protein [Chlamydiales bacterium]MCH9703958.1 hypothetical protein [Chlamydiota bacterium]
MRIFGWAYMLVVMGCIATKVDAASCKEATLLADNFYVWTCINCGARNAEGAPLCISCGQRRDG